MTSRSSPTRPSVAVLIPGESTPRGRPLAEIAKKHGVTPRAVILAFLTREANVFAIPKAASIPHVEENARAGDVDLDADDIAEIEKVYPRSRSTELRML